MQFQADVLGRPVRRAKMAETTVLGAAMLAGLACGLWRSPAELRALGGRGWPFRPSMRPGERERLVKGWHAAVARVRT
jgi:glycerol kinase